VTLGIVISTPPARGDFERAERLARAARARGLEVGVFLMDEAVHWAADARIAGLLDEGCDVWACGLSVTRAGVECQRGVVVGSQDDHAALAHRADRLVALT
jgi:hypothetical protein